MPGRTQRATTDYDHDFAELVRVWFKWLVWLAPFDGYWKAIGAKPVFCFEGKHRGKNCLPDTVSK